VSTLHVRNVPEPIHRALRKRARERGSSVSAETIRLLGRAGHLSGEWSRVVEVVEAASKANAKRYAELEALPHLYVGD